MAQHFGYGLSDLAWLALSDLVAMTESVARTDEPDALVEDHFTI